jgi:hypothetical protein
MSGSVPRIEPPDEDSGEASGPEAPGGVDQSFASRRLRRWIEGMFGGEVKPAAEHEPGREKGLEP